MRTLLELELAAREGRYDLSEAESAAVKAAIRHADPEHAEELSALFLGEAAEVDEEAYRNDDGPCLACGAYGGDHDAGCMLGQSASLSKPKG